MDELQIATIKDLERLVDGHVVCRSEEGHRDARPKSVRATTLETVVMASERVEERLRQARNKIEVLEASMKLKDEKLA